MLDEDHVPLVKDHVCDLHAVALDCRWAVVLGEHPVDDLVAWVYVALKPTIPLRETVKKHW